jgi:N-acetylneuraminic acid mutarotase
LSNNEPGCSFLGNLCAALLSTTYLVDFSTATTTENENTWEIKSPAPAGTYGCKAAVVNEKIYLIGGSLNYMYDPETDSWVSRKPMPTPRTVFGIAVWQDKIYVIGGSAGFDWNNGRYNVSNATEVYDPSNDTWQTKQSMPTARVQLEANVVDGEIYLISGRTGGPLSTVYLNEVYNIANDSWTTKAPIPYSVAGYQSAVCNKKIYILGGQDDNLYDREHSHSPTLLAGDIDLDITQIYDPSNDSWTFGASMPTHVKAPAAAATTGVMAARRIYLIGGYNIGDNYIGHLQNCVQEYDPEHDAWTYKASMPTARESLTIGVVNDRLYAIGRYGHNDNEAYTPSGYGTPDPAYIFETTAPTIVFSMPSNLTVSDGSLSLNFTVNKPVEWIRYSLDNKDNATVDGNFTLTDLANGFHNLTVYAQDTFGNVGAETINFTVAMPFPILFAMAVLGLLVAALTLGLFAYRKMRRSTANRSQLS